MNTDDEYHTLVIPKDHNMSIFDAPAAEIRHVVAAVKHVVDLFLERLGYRERTNHHLFRRRRPTRCLPFSFSPHPEMREHFDELLAQLQ